MGQKKGMKNLKLLDKQYTGKCEFKTLKSALPPTIFL